MKSEPGMPPRTADPRDLALASVVSVVGSRRLSEEACRTRFDEDLGLTSLDAVCLLVDIEEYFGITVTDIEARQLVTVGDLVALLRKRIGMSQDSSNLRPG